MKIICVLFPLAFVLWVAGVATIAFGNAETFGLSWLMQLAGSIGIGWLLILIFADRPLNQANLSGVSRALILLLIFCFYLVFPAGVITEWISNLAGASNFFPKAEVIKNLGFPLFLYVLCLDAINISIAALVCTGLIFGILKIFSKMDFRK